LQTFVRVVALSNTSDDKELQQLKDNQTTLLALTSNLTNLNNKISSDNENLRKNYTNLRVQCDNLTQASAVLKSTITSLTAENQDLKTQRNNLTQRIQNMERNSNELNISRTQWSIDAYCPRESNGRKCNACQKGWELFQSSCYTFNDAEPPNQKTWEEAREDCRGKISDLAVIDNDTEKVMKKM
uniref:C-type lectin domain family 12 member B-like n=1 Tax=Monopterus albus TaxID=43700 RepID=UPI0009B35209